MNAKEREWSEGAAGYSPNPGLSTITVKNAAEPATFIDSLPVIAQHDRRGESHMIALSIRRPSTWAPVVRAFTLIELLVVVSIIGLLVAILVPSLGRARAQGKSVGCASRLRNLGQGIIMYASDNQGRLVPGRLPRVDDQNWQTGVAGGIKYRPTFLAMMGAQVGIPAFDDPQSNRREFDRYGEPGDRQNYSSEVYVCPETPEWTDERNGSYGYNYQFLGNSRLLDETNIYSFKNWPVIFSRIRTPSACVAVADSMGTAASFPPLERRPYENNGRDHQQYGNEGFNLDPPWVDPVNGEMADLDGSPPTRTAVHERHAGKASALWLDHHVTSETLRSLGYTVEPNGVVGLTGDNRLWTPDGQNRPWQQP